MKPIFIKKIKTNRSISFMVPALVFVGLEILSFKPSWFYWAIPLILLITFFGVWKLTGSKFNKDFLKLLITPFLFTLSGVVFFIFITPQGLVLKHLFILMVGILLYLALINVFTFLYRLPTYHSHSLENVFNYLNLVTAFLFFSSFYSFIIINGSLFWLIELAVVLLSACLISQTLWLYKLLNKKSILFVLVITLILAEVFWATSFFPTSFYVNGLILTLIYYSLTEIAHYFLMDKLESKALRRHLIITIIIFLIISLTTRWN